jgi:hypothetical protein
MFFIFFLKSKEEYYNRNIVIIVKKEKIRKNKKYIPNIANLAQKSRSFPRKE